MSLAEPSFITSAARVPPLSPTRKRKLNSDGAAEGGHAPKHVQPSPPLPAFNHVADGAGPPSEGGRVRSRTGSINLTAVPILVPASALARRGSADRHLGPVPVTLPTAVLTRRASVDRGATVVDALFSPNYHAPLTEVEPATEPLPASSSWASEPASSRRSSVGSLLDVSFTHTPSSEMVVGPPTAEADYFTAGFARAVAAPPAPSSPDRMDHDEAVSQTGEELVPAGSVVLQPPETMGGTWPSNVVVADSGAAAVVAPPTVSTLASILGMSAVLDLVAAAHKAAEAAAHAEFDPFLFIRHLPPLLGERPLRLPSKPSDSPQMTLVLDLDETLVHCSTMAVENADRMFQVTLNSQVFDVYMNQRPYLIEFLEKASQWYEIIVFTASQEIYADKLLDLIDPDRRWIKHRLFRDSCVYVQGNYLKDLSVLGREMSQSVIIDNSPQAFGYQLWNGIPIESWYDDRQDRELLKMLAFLETLVGVEDVRPVLRDVFRLHEFIP